MAQKDSIFVQESQDYQTSNVENDVYEALACKNNQNYHINSHESTIIVAETENFDTQLNKFNADTANYSPPRKKLIVDSQNVNALSPPLFDDSTQEFEHKYNSSPVIIFSKNLCPKSANTNKNTKASDFNNFHVHEKAVFSNSEPNNISRHLKLQIIGAQINNDFDLLNTIDNTQYVDLETRLNMDSCKNSQLILTNPQNRLSYIINHESQMDQPQIVAQTAISTASSNVVDGCASSNTRKQLRAKKKRGLVKSDRLSFSQKVTKKVLKKYATQQHSQTTGPTTLSGATNPRFSSVLERLYNDQNGPRTSFRFKEYRDSNVATQSKGKVKKTSNRKSVVAKRTPRSKKTTNQSTKKKAALKTPEPARTNTLTPKTPTELGIVPLIITSTNSSDAFKQAPTFKTKTLPVLNAQTNDNGPGEININSAPQPNRFLTYNPSGFHLSTSASPVSMQEAWDREVKDIYAFSTYYTITKKWLRSQMVEEIKGNEVAQEPCLIDSIEVTSLNYTPANVVGRVVERPSSGSRLADISSSVKTADDIQMYEPVRVNPSPSVCFNSTLVQFKGAEDAIVKTLKQTRLFKAPLRLSPKLSGDAQLARLHQCCAALNVKASPAQMRSLQKILYGDDPELACSPVPINDMRKGSIIIASDSNSAVPETMDECIPTSTHENDLTRTAKSKPRISSPRLVINKFPPPANINNEPRLASNQGKDAMVNEDDVAKAASFNASKLKISKLESVIEILGKLKIEMVWARWRKNSHLYPGKIVGTTTPRKMGKKTGQKFKVKFVDGDLAVCDACDILLTKRPFYTTSSDVDSVVYDMLNIEFPHHTPVLANLSTPSEAPKNKVWYEECLIINNSSDEKSDGQSPMLCVRRKDDKGLAIGKEEVHRISFEQIVLSEGAMKEAGLDMSFLPKLSCLLQDLSVNSDNEITSNSLSESHNSTNKAPKNDTFKIDDSTEGIYRTPTKLEQGAISCSSPPLQGMKDTTKACTGRRRIGMSPSKALAKEPTKADTPNLAILGPLLPKGSQIFKDISFLLTHKPSGSEKGQNSASISKSPAIKRATRSKVKLPFSSNSNEALNSTSSNSSSSLNEYPTVEFNKQYLIDQMNSGDGVVLETFDECLSTTLNRRIICVADSYSRTEKYLKCLAADFPCLSHLYIIECCRQNKLLGYENFTLPAGKSILKNCSLSRKKIGNMFNAIKVTFVPANPRSLATDEKLCLSLLQSMGFQVTISKLILDLKPDVLVAVYKNDALSNKAREQKIPLVCIEWVIQSLIHAELLPYHAHESFYNF